MTVDAYLGELSKELRGLVTEKEQIAFVCEQQTWLDGRIRDLVLSGFEYSEAEAQVVARNGEPKKLARRIAFEAFEDGVNTPIYNFIGRANVNANSVFGLVGGFYLCFLQTRLFMPTENPLPISNIPVNFRNMPLLYPDMSWQYYVTVGFPFIAPWVAGVVCGKLIPIGAARAVYNEIMIMTIACFLMGLLFLPDQTALIFAAILALYWLPVGCLTAHLSSFYFLWLRRRKLGRHGWIPSTPVTIQEKHSQ